MHEILPQKSSYPFITLHTKSHDPPSRPQTLSPIDPFKELPPKIILRNPACSFVQGLCGSLGVCHLGMQQCRRVGGARGFAIYMAFRVQAPTESGLGLGHQYGSFRKFGAVFWGPFLVRSYYLGYYIRVLYFRKLPYFQEVSTAACDTGNTGCRKTLRQVQDPEDRAWGGTVALRGGIDGYSAFE